MASASEIASLRRMVNEPTATTYNDDTLGALIDDSVNLAGAAASIWQEKASRFAQLVNVKEGSSSRDLGDLYEQALSMSTHYTGASLAAAGGRKPARTRTIERA